MDINCHKCAKIHTPSTYIAKSPHITTIHYTIKYPKVKADGQKTARPALRHPARQTLHSISQGSDDQSHPQSPSTADPTIVPPNYHTTQLPHFGRTSFVHPSLILLSSFTHPSLAIRTSPAEAAFFNSHITTKRLRIRGFILYPSQVLHKHLISTSYTLPIHILYTSQVTAPNSTN